MPFIVGFLVILINIILIFITNVNWITLLIFNVIVSLSLLMLGLGEYDLLSRLIIRLATLIWELIEGVFNGIIAGIKSLLGAGGGCSYEPFPVDPMPY